MMIPTFTINNTNQILGLPNSGDLVFEYNAFQNLNNPEATQVSLEKLRLTKKEAGLDISEPLELNLEESYDGSINMIITDKKNPPKIVNSRFYTTSATEYNVADRSGNVDTNIYSKENFIIEASLVKTVKSIVSVEFTGIFDGGKLPIGNYTFYFKLADADGNESDFVAESGNIVCHIGTVNNPKSIRGGQLNENSEKLIKLELNDLDLSYNYINIYYTRSTGDGTSELVKAYKINDKIKITGTTTPLIITGYEEHEEIGVDEINIRYTSFESVKTIENCQNITFAGNISNDFEIYKQLEKLSLHITPKLVQDTEGIGNLSSTYDEVYKNSNSSYEYYNAKNIYYKLGLWTGEIYRYGIMYVLNDYTLSPVFNIRGIKELGSSPDFHSFEIDDEINYGEDYLIDGYTNENVKGVFKISNDYKVFNNSDPIKPIGVSFNIPKSIYDGTDNISGLKDLTKGFVIVRQKRIPTILAQTIGIATSKRAKIPVLYGSKSGEFSAQYFSEAFLQNFNSKPKLGSSYFTIPNDISYISRNALLCPEANVRIPFFNSVFNSSEFLLEDTGYLSGTGVVNHKIGNQFEYSAPTNSSPGSENVLSDLLLIEPGIELISDRNDSFSSMAGNAEFPEKHLNPVLGNYEDPTSSTSIDWNSNITKVRGIYNTYIGCSNDEIVQGRYYNVRQKDYHFTNLWKEYFKLRYNDNTPYFQVGNRIAWENLVENDLNLVTPNFFRGDCYINTYTHRMNWNFIDPELPTNHRIIDPFTWNKNFKIKTTKVKSITNEGQLKESTTLTYNKLLDLFTYDGTKIIEPDDKGYKTSFEANGAFGVEKLNRPDVNAVPLGHWVTFKICSSTNLAMRDIDFSNPAEEAIHKQKRGFYPLQAMERKNHLPESNVINQGISAVFGSRYYFDLPEVPFIKTNFANRIYYSNILQNFSFTNGNRVFKSVNYQDYTMEYGALVKLIEWFGTLIAVMEHGILLIPVNERAMMANESGQNVYINTENVLPQNPQVISSTFGSTWPDSIIKTTRYIYGIDTVAKKIWRTDGKSFENISDMQIQKFLNDNIKISELENKRVIGTKIVKTHFNAFKSDVYFTLKYGELQWNLCWNELLNKWVTKYSWFPEFSENINNIFYTFANQTEHTNASNYLYKHGFAGGIEQSGEILPTKWYDTVYPFEFEFVVSDLVSSQKIFDNLKLIANATPPHSFEFEVIGNGFDWVNDKTIIVDNIPTDVLETVTRARYYNYLHGHPSKIKLPFIHMLLTTWPSSSGTILRDLTLYKNNKTKEVSVKVYQKGQDLKFPGMTRLKANMQYLEDIWEVQIQPIKFQYIYLLNGVLTMSDFKESKLRDKYLKVRVRYDGNDYAIINAIKTIYTVSYA